MCYALRAGSTPALHTRVSITPAKFSPPELIIRTIKCSMKLAAGKTARPGKGSLPGQTTGRQALGREAMARSSGSIPDALHNH